MFKVRIEPHGQWTTELQVVTDMGALEAALPDIRGRPSMARGLQKWMGKAPQLKSSVESLKTTSGAALSTWQPCVSRPPWQQATACGPPDCRGS